MAARPLLARAGHGLAGSDGIRDMCGQLRVGVVMSIVSRVDAYQREHRLAGLPVAVLYKFGDDQGTYLAAQITYYGFVAAFPLLLLLATILGYALHGNP